MRHDFELSLNELAGQQVADIYGFVTRLSGEPTFQLSRVVFADGRTVYVGGEHDTPYLEDTGGVVKLPVDAEGAKL